jgi:hypothetical protein
VWEAPDDVIQAAGAVRDAVRRYGVPEVCDGGVPDAGSMALMFTVDDLADLHVLETMTVTVELIAALGDWT